MDLLNYPCHTAVMGVPTGKPLGGLGVSRFLVPIIALIVFYFIWKSGEKWPAVPLVVALVFYYTLLPRWVASRLAIFHREALKLLSMGKAREMPELVRRSLFLQIFAPRGPLEAKLGLAFMQFGDYKRAIPVLQIAADHCRPEERVAVQTGLAEALFKMGAFSQAIEVGMTVIEGGTRLPELLVTVADARMRLGRFNDQTRALLDEASSLSTSPALDAVIETSLRAFERRCRKH